jgi:hypothetical protein
MHEKLSSVILERCGWVIPDYRERPERSSGGSRVCQLGIQIQGRHSGGPPFASGPFGELFCSLLLLFAPVNFSLKTRFLQSISSESESNGSSSNSSSGSVALEELSLFELGYNEHLKEVAACTEFTWPCAKFPPAAVRDNYMHNKEFISSHSNSELVIHSIYIFICATLSKKSILTVMYIKLQTVKKKRMVITQISSTTLQGNV